MGITEGLIKDFKIEPCLIYGHPMNKNQQLFLSRLFGGKIERTNIAATMEEEEVEVIINTVGLSNEFYIYKGGYKT